MDKKILIILGVSLALNFTFIGFEASRIYYQRPVRIPAERPNFAPKHMPDFQENGLIRETFKETFKNHGKEMKEAIKNVKASLQKENFDIEEFKAALQKAAEVRSALDSSVQEKTVEVVSKMSPQERQRFSKQFERKNKRFKPKKGFFKKEGFPCAKKYPPHDCPYAKKHQRHSEQPHPNDAEKK